MIRITDTPAMTVKQLIEKLKEYNENDAIYFPDETFGLLGVKRVRKSEKYKDYLIIDHHD